VRHTTVMIPSGAEPAIKIQTLIMIQNKPITTAYP